MVLSHDPLKTWGKFLRCSPALAKQRHRRDYDAVKLPAAYGIPALYIQGCRGAWQIRQTESKSGTMGRVCDYEAQARPIHVVLIDQ